MKGLELLKFLDKEQISLIKNSEQNYKRFVHIHFQILSFENNEIIVKVWQTENVVGSYLPAKELLTRAKDIFQGMIPENIKLYIRPIPFDPLANFSLTDIENQMNELGLQAKDLVKLLDIDKSTISSLLARNRNLSKATKAMFYYLFKYLKTNKVS
jgi:hypothetical protein